MRDSRRIALIDGSDDRLRRISSALESIPDVSVVRFTDPVAALEEIRERNGFDLIVTEMTMTRMNATTFIRDLRSGSDPVQYWVVVYGSSLQSVAGMRNVACTEFGEGAQELELEILRGTVSRVLIDSEHQMNVVNLKLDVRSLRQDVREIKDSQVCKADLDCLKNEIADIVNSAVLNCRSTSSCPSPKVSFEDMIDAVGQNRTAMLALSTAKFCARHAWKIALVFVTAFATAVVYAVKVGLK